MVCLTIDDILESKKMALKIAGGSRRPTPVRLPGATVKITLCPARNVCQCEHRDLDGQNPKVPWPCKEAGQMKGSPVRSLPTHAGRASRAAGFCTFHSGIHRDGCQQREVIWGHMGLCEALELRKSVARVIWSQTGHIWKYNYREASVAGGARPVLGHQHCEQAWAHTPSSPRVHTLVIWPTCPRCPECTPLSPRMHTLIAQARTPSSPRAHALIIQHAHSHRPECTLSLPRVNALITQTAHPSCPECRSS